MSLIDDLNWRYATKKMNGEPVPQEKVDYILEAARMAPSSSGLQPYKVFVITNKELRERIKSIANNQSQLTDGSHLLVWAAWDGYSLSRIGEVFEKTTQERGLPSSVMDDYKNSLWSMYEPLSKEWQAAHAAKQAYISFGMAIAAAAEQKVDATPMEGFDNQALDEILGLPEKGLKSVVILPLGYRDIGGDWLVNLKKYRTPKEEFVIEIK
ncbi:NAD(P)H-dependent oxidoreductase [Chryseobacterium sp. SC28]|uniref:NAD(P)H-dependent oxidoreductase n=1 Tax=Chryseobacterium sp. SC28 TaxID=2268028 RepID=UPI000F652586|nr:NAD(P)H-dependent oxidoreductase [Chryseobacterium sp. SC28]RRQ47120.1 NAD(P)H-dependent oxidoreductase [Chryseobacterium sp. SC28]